MLVIHHEPNNATPQQTSMGKNLVWAQRTISGMMTDRWNCWLSPGKLKANCVSPLMVIRSHSVCQWEKELSLPVAWTGISQRYLCTYSPSEIISGLGPKRFFFFITCTYYFKRTSRTSSTSLLFTSDIIAVLRSYPVKSWGNSPTDPGACSDYTASALLPWIGDNAIMMSVEALTKRPHVCSACTVD